MSFRVSKKQYFLILAANLLWFNNVGANPMRAPDEARLAEARQLVERMKSSPRGPYKQIRWYCNDGSVHPPKPYACSERGGGKQYGEYSEDRQRLAELGWSVGTVITALSWDEFIDADRRHQRLREIPLEKYLTDIDNGWVLQKAKNYRGRIQIEDEERFGREFLQQLAEQPDWVTDNYLLLRELVRTVPHGSGSDATRDIRRFAQNIADQENSFEHLRIEIHSTPSADTIGRLAHWIEKFDVKPGKEHLLEMAQQLLATFEQLYGEAGRQQRLMQVRTTIGKYPNLTHLHSLLVTEENETEFQKAERLGLLLEAIRDAQATPMSGSKRLLLLDGLADIEAELRLTTSTLLLRSPLPRAELIALARFMVSASYGGGFLSAGERESVMAVMQPAVNGESITLAEYIAMIESLNLTGTWALGAVRYAFAEPLMRYTALEPRSANFVDDLLRGSPLLQLAQISKRLAFDAQSLGRIQKMLFGESASGLLALNPGIAAGQLYIASEQETQDGLKVSREQIVVLPQTVSELPPVAGVMTVGESNMLSHVQLLARNFGIPNIALTPALFDKLKPFHGKQIVVGASNDGSVVIATPEQLSESQRGLLNQQVAGEGVKLTVAKPDLSVTEPLPINEINVELSGKVIGPKAANLGKLYSLFPGKVAPAIALPFGLFFNEVNTNPQTQWQQLSQLYGDYQGGLIDRVVLEQRLAGLRTELMGITLSDGLREKLNPLLEAWFGKSGSYGLFIRSDTNVEDLPGFTGAGLSETLPNVVGGQALFKGIPYVWGSVLAPRAIAWRSNLLTNPEQIYPSVLLMKSVAVEKSGVLVTSDLYKRKEGLTVSTAWGIGGAVGGETTETLLLKPDGSEILLSQAKAPYQRSLSEQGGIQWVPAPKGFVLTADEKQQLRALVIDVKQHYGLAKDEQGNVLPWDIEFGFKSGALQLFQIRPLIERGQAKADSFTQQKNHVATDLSLAVPLNETAIEALEQSQ